MSAYSEIEKSSARNLAISSAIKKLTTQRHSSTIARKKYVREVRDYLIKEGTASDKKYASLLSDSEVNHWESFYMSIVGKKKASDLKVAYLSGPNPENDLEVLVDNGILPENVWAFESDKNTYSNAVMAALESDFPFVKIYRGRIENYLKLLPFRFDIIYLDFCGTITSPKTLSVIREIFYHQKLNSPGILITNFAFPPKSKTNIAHRKNLINLAANYIYPKSFSEEFTKMGGGFRESAESWGIDEEEFIKIAQRNPKTFYSQFITRVLFDLPSVIIPYQKFFQSEALKDTFFKNFNRESFDEDYDEDVMFFPNDNSLLWGLSDYLIKDDVAFLDLLKKFKKQLAINSSEDFLLDSIELVSYFIGESTDDNLHSDQLEKIRKNWIATQKYIFCDVFMFHQLKDILIGQLTAPYFYNVNCTKRWMYKAKETEMFLDMITYDECRYIFDWMPTLDMFEEGVGDMNRQLALRFAMDSVSKQRRWYNDEFFAGTAVIDQDTHGFKAQQLRKRKVIK